MNIVNENNKHLAQTLFHLREERHLSQEEFATSLGVTRQAVSRWEMGISVPNINTILLISKKFKVSVDEIVKEAPEEFTDTQSSAEKKPLNVSSIPGYVMTFSGITGLICIPVLAEFMKNRKMALYLTAYEHSYHYIFEYPLSIVLISAIFLLTLGIYMTIKREKQNKKD